MVHGQDARVQYSQLTLGLNIQPLPGPSRQGQSVDERHAAIELASDHSQVRSGYRSRYSQSGRGYRRRSSGVEQNFILPRRGRLGCYSSMLQARELFGAVLLRTSGKVLRFRRLGTGSAGLAEAE